MGVAFRGHTVPPEMRKLFLRISREDCQQSPTIANNSKQSPAIAGTVCPVIRKELTITYVVVCKRRNKA